MRQHDLTTCFQRWVSSTSQGFLASWHWHVSFVVGYTERLGREACWGHCEVPTMVTRRDNERRTLAGPSLHDHRWRWNESFVARCCKRCEGGCSGRPENAKPEFQWCFVWRNALYDTRVHHDCSLDGSKVSDSHPNSSFLFYCIFTMFICVFFFFFEQLKVERGILRRQKRQWSAKLEPLQHSVSPLRKACGLCTGWSISW